jgi:hypothetical protein
MPSKTRAREAGNSRRRCRPSGPQHAPGHVRRMSRLLSWPATCPGHVAGAQMRCRSVLRAGRAPSPHRTHQTRRPPAADSSPDPNPPHTRGHHDRAIPDSTHVPRAQDDRTLREKQVRLNAISTASVYGYDSASRTSSRSSRTSTPRSDLNNFTRNFVDFKGSSHRATELLRARRASSTSASPRTMTICAKEHPRVWHHHLTPLEPRMGRSHTSNPRTRPFPRHLK